MRFYKLNGSVTSKDVTKYLIEWSAKSRSKYQSSVKFALQPYWKTQVVYEEFPVVGTKMTLDLVNLTKRIALEVQGEQHQTYNPFFHGKSKVKFWHQLDRDIKKREWCELNDLRIVEVFPDDLPLTKKRMQELKLI